MTDELTTNPFAKRHHYARRVVAGSALLLIAATKPLWFSQGEFPQVPFFEFLCETPQWVDWILSGGLVLSLLAMMLLKADFRGNLISGGVTIGCAVALIALNQHRLQPWAWFLILATVATSATADASLKWLRWLLFGVYFFSGLSKLEPTFVNGGGNWILDGLCKPFGGSYESFDASTRRLLLYLMPLGEIVAAICVIIPRLRLVGFFLVLGMHGTLLLALGPLGLNHKPGVLLWNLEFQLLAFPLLWKLPANRVETTSPQWSKAAGAVVIAGGILLPCFGQRWLPIVDQWPSWSVYATWQQEEPEVQVHVHIAAEEFLEIPVGGVQYVSSDWAEVPLNEWSLEVVGAPMYPQRRFHLGIAESLRLTSGLPTAFVDHHNRPYVLWNSVVSVGDNHLMISGFGDMDDGKVANEPMLNYQPRSVPGNR